MTSDGFQHEALLYAGEDGFLAGTVPFIMEGLANDEPVLVAVAPLRIAVLRAELGEVADEVQFADMGELGANPARIIPRWRDFLDAHGGGSRPVRGIGEPIWPGRRPAELVESQRHEALLNVAFARSGSLRLLCPYDVSALDDAVVHEARCSHPTLVVGDERRPSAECRDLDAMAGPFDWPLDEPDVEPATLPFELADLAEMRRFVWHHAEAAGLSADRIDEVVLAAHEIVTNSIIHGGGWGVLRSWVEEGSLIYEVRDGGMIRDPLADRTQPSTDQLGGRGLWLANQFCDLVQIRSYPSGNVIRLHMRCRGTEAGGP